MSTTSTFNTRIRDDYNNHQSHHTVGNTKQNI